MPLPNKPGAETEHAWKEIRGAVKAYDKDHAETEQAKKDLRAFMVKEGLRPPETTPVEKRQYKKCETCSEDQRAVCKADPAKKLECIQNEMAMATEERYAEPITKYPKGIAAVFHKNKEKNGHLIIKEIGDTIVRLDKFIHFRDSEDLLKFDGCIYREYAEQYIREVCNRMLAEESTIQHGNEVVGYIKTLSDDEVQHLHDHTSIDTPVVLIPFKNGAYNIVTRTLGAYDSSIPFFNQLPVSYDADADCPRFKQFLGEVLNEGDIAVVQEWLGYCLYRGYPFAKSLLAVGKGRNGKTVLLNVINAMVGPQNVSHVSLQQLTTNRFAMANLYNKYVNTYADLPDKTVYDTGNFKILTGGDPITAEKKNKPFFNFTNYAKPTFSCNKIPESYDETDAFYERLIIVNFPNQFLGDKADDKLLEKLKAELAGIVNYALEGLQRLLAQRSFTYNKSLEETRKYYKRQSSTVAAYAEDCLEVDVESKLKKEAVYNDYVSYCKRLRLVPLHRDIFAKKLPHEVEVSSTRISEGQGKPHAWAGIRFKDRGQDLVNGESIEDYTQPAQPTHPSSVPAGSNSIKVNCERIQPSQPSQPFEVLSKRSESGNKDGEKGGQVGQVGQKEKKEVAEGAGDVDSALLAKFEAYLERAKSVGSTKAATDLGIQEDVLTLLVSRSGKATWSTHGSLSWSPVKLPRGEKLIADCRKCGSKTTIHVPQDQRTATIRCAKCGEEYKFSKLKIHCTIPNCNATYTDWFLTMIPMGNQSCALCKTVGFLEVLKEDGK